MWGKMKRAECVKPDPVTTERGHDHRPLIRKGANITERSGFLWVTQRRQPGVIAGY